MYELEKTFRFEAGHTLPYHDGKCASLHGHSYSLTIILRSPTLVSSGPKQNMVADFNEISNVVKPMIEAYFDHHWLNDTLSLSSPTAEIIANWVFDFLKPKLPNLYKVVVAETDTARASYFLS
jgi:6-pyruvoyltetrahydropterin/6-carboxytetrahydropterin synthase